MPGLDQARIIGATKKELDQITCLLCQKIFVYPLTTKCCGHTYCRECIEYWLTLNTVCPNDRQTLDLNDLIQTNEEILNQLFYLRVKCDNHLKGCQTVIRLSEMDSHLMDCEFNVCADCGLEKGRGKQHNCFENMKKSIEYLAQEKKNLILRQDSTSVISMAKKDLADYFIINIKGFDNKLLNNFVNHIKHAIEEEDTFRGISKHIFLNIKNTFTFKAIHWVVLVNHKDNCVACLDPAKYILDICFGNLEIKIIGFK